MAKLDIDRIAAPKCRNQLDWMELAALRSKSNEADKLVQWLQHCIKQRRAEPFKQEQP